MMNTYLKIRYLMSILSFNEFINESLRHTRQKIDYSNIKYVYHWLNEGQLFSQIYDEPNKDEFQKFILRKSNGKKIEMPSLPPKKYLLGGDKSNVCMTLDPEYTSAGFTGESYICLVLNLQKLIKDFKIEDLTDNGEAEIRIEKIPQFNKYLEKVFIVKKNYEKGDGWEGFYYRPIQEWYTQDLKLITEILPSVKSISKELKTKYL
jgi:hypothetical protein